MTHVRVERLAPSHDEEDGAEHGEPVPAVFAEEGHGMSRIDGGQHDRLAHEPHHPERRDDHEPRHHDRPEQPADPVGAVALDREHADEDQHGDRDDVAVEERRRHLEALDRAQHRDRRRDHAVAVEQGRAEDAEQHERSRSRPTVGARRKERGQCQDATLALVVGAHHDRDVLDRDDQQQRVDDQREHAEDVFVSGGHRVRSKKAFAHRVQGTRADVAVDDADCGEGERKELARGRAGGNQECLQCRRRG